MSRPVDRRRFLRTTGLGAAACAATGVRVFAQGGAARPPAAPGPETLVHKLWNSLGEDQRREIAFDWDHVDPRRGLLRTFVANNWRITRPAIGSAFFTDDQKDLIRTIFEGLYDPGWLPRVDRQLRDDAGGYGRAQSIALFGRPGSDRFELVMTGRHLTIRCDGNSAEHVAFGGPVFYGHAARGFRERKDHPGNVYWPQAVAANRVFDMLDGRQRALALVSRSPREQDVGFRGAGSDFPGIPVAALSPDQKEQVRRTLAALLAPYRAADRAEARRCLAAQGGLDRVSLAFYADADIGGDGVWDNWRLEGPSFVWHFRGRPHVHVWVHVADDAAVALNTGGRPRHGRRRRQG